MEKLLIKYTSIVPGGGMGGLGGLGGRGGLGLFTTASKMY